MNPDNLNKTQFKEHPQFEVLNKNRTVQMGNRTYPAAWTGEYHGGGHALIPMENGNLVSVEHMAQPSNGYEAGYHTMEASGDSMHHAATVDALHEHLEHLRSKTLPDDRVASNRETLANHLKWNAEGVGQ